MKETLWHNGRQMQSHGWLHSLVSTRVNTPLQDAICDTYEKGIKMSTIVRKFDKTCSQIQH
jgi:hypothetical protein